MLACSMGIGLLINNNLIAIFAQMATSVCVYFIMLLLLKDQFIFEGINTIKKKIFKKDTITK